MEEAAVKYFKGIVACLCVCTCASALAFQGTNNPGSFMDFQVSVAAGNNTLALEVLKSQDGVGSYILVKFGSAITGPTDFNFASRVDGGDNRVALERPELQTGTYFVRVHTPASATGPHSFTLTSTLDSPVRTATFPANKPQVFSTNGSFTAAGDQFFRFIAPTGVQGGRVVVNATGGNCTLHLLTENASGSEILTSSTTTQETLLMSDTLLVAGNAYCIRVEAQGALTYSLVTDNIYLRDLTWDPGTNPDGTNVISQPDLNGGDYLFRVVTQSSNYGAWRTALKVTAGEANLYQSNNTPPVGTSADYKSELAGSDGFVLYAQQFSDNQTWYIKVRAAKNATWSICSGDIYVHDLGTLAAFNSAASSSQALPVGVRVNANSHAVPVKPEGCVFFKTSIPANTLAWRLWLEGNPSKIYVKKASAAVPEQPAINSFGSYERVEDAQMLLVPDYLTTAQYVVGVKATIGSGVALDSRQQQIRMPTASGAPDNFAFSINGSDDGGYGYVTYEIDVPVNQIAWQSNCAPATGTCDHYIRSGKVPNLNNNDALSEAAGNIIDSITMVPPVLTQGVWYLTVHGTGSFTYTLSSGNPVITAKAYINDPAVPANLPRSSGAAIVNDAPNINRSGWRYYQINDIQSQLGTLGWELLLSNQVAGTEIALRRNNVPSRWNFRSGDSTSTATNSQVDYSGTTGFLQRPGHVADIWYIGIYIPDVALGAFTLTTHEIGSTDLTFNGGTVSPTNIPFNFWKYYKVIVPSGPLGWDIRLKNVTSGAPQFVVRRDLLPADFGYITAGGPAAGLSSIGIVRQRWISGDQWPGQTGYEDWTGRYYTSDPGSVIENGQILAMGMNTPLEPGTYYVGVKSSQNAQGGAIGCTLLSRGIGIGNDANNQPWSIQVQDLAFNGAGSTVNGSGLGVREAAYYRVTVPANTKSWNMKLVPTAGESLMAVRLGALPTVSAGYYYYYPDSDDQYVTCGAKRQKNGREIFYKYAPYNATTITPGTYYVAVVGEGNNPADSSHAGTGTVSYSLTSAGEVVINDKTSSNLTAATPVTWPGETMLYGEQKVYRFRVPANVAALSIKAKNVTGSPLLSVVRHTVGNGKIPLPNYSFFSGYRASEGGDNPQLSVGTTIMNFVQPDAGDYTLLVLASVDDQGAEVNLALDLEVSVISATNLTFNGGSDTVVNQAPDTWQYYKVVVPADANLLGWDLRLKNVTSGEPQMVVRRDLLPGNFNYITDGYTQIPSASISNIRSHWASGDQWPAEYAGSDWTTRYYQDAGAPEKGQIIACGIGSPLEPGTYLIGVKNSSTSGPMSYTVASRGIGIGNDSTATPWSIQVQDLNFTNGTLNKSNLAPREAAYYRVTVPANSKGWSLKMVPTVGEALLCVRQGALPNVSAGYYAGAAPADSNGYFAGIKRQKDGQEFYYMYPPPNTPAITSGTYFLAVVSEGATPIDSSHIGANPVNFTITSNGELTVNDKTAVALTLNSTVNFNAESLQFGQQKAYRFRVPAGLASISVKYLNVTGFPQMSLIGNIVGSGRIPVPNISSGYYNAADYGDFTNNQGKLILTLAQPFPGDYTLLATTNPDPNTSAQTDAAYDIEVSAQGVVDLPFNGGSLNITSQSADTWRYFRVVVPATALGWDLRLKNVTSGEPDMAVRRELLPADFGYITNGFNGSFNSSISRLSHHWIPGDQLPGENGSGDWTTRYYTSAAGNNADKGRTLMVGMGNPLDPGTYIIGVKNSVASAAMTYTIASRGIGIGNDPGNQPWALQVQDLTFTGAGSTVNGSNLAPREAAYYRVTVPPNAKSWSMNLVPTVGEALLCVRRGGLPNLTAGYYNDHTESISGAKRQKDGQEFFYKYLDHASSTLNTGTYYIAVVSEGNIPLDSSHIGASPVSYTLTSNGEMPINDKTATPLSFGSTINFPGESLVFASQKVYRFRVPAGIPNMVVKYKNVIGHPTLTMMVHPSGFGKIPAPYSQNYVASEDGDGPVLYNNPPILNLPAPAAGDYTIIATADYDQGAANDAQMDIEVSTLATTTLNIDAVLNAGNGGTNTALNKQLGDGELHYYQVTVPANMTLANNETVFGWRLDAPTANGAASIRVKKGALPSLTGQGQRTVSSSGPAVTLVPPFLEPGTWFIEIRGNGNTTYSLTSSIVRALRPTANETAPNLTWTMPLNSNITFGDTGIKPDGTPVVNPNTGDQGTDIPSKGSHYYKIVVPPGNGGLLRSKLEALSGSTQLFIRETGVPTQDHDIYGDSGSIYDRNHNGTGTTYGNWVPLNPSASPLRAGTWWLMVYANGASNARYRLVLSTGDIQTLAISGGSYTNQTLAAGDFRYYKVTVPANPQNWSITFTQSLGDAAILIRDTVPPGFGSVNGNISGGFAQQLKDWATDANSFDLNAFFAIDNPGTYSLPVPPVKPGATYYLGVFGQADSTYGISSSVNGGALSATTLPFYGGNASATLNAGEKKLYKIDIPADAIRWFHTATSDPQVQFFLRQGTVPFETQFDDFNSAGDHTFTKIIDPATAPWQPGKTFYLTVKNTAATALPFTYQLAGAPPQIISVTPVDNSTGVATNAALSITFDRAFTPSATNYLQIRAVAGDVYLDGYFATSPEVSITGNTLTINRTLNIPARTDVYIYMVEGFVNGQFGAVSPALTDKTKWNFRTLDTAASPVPDLGGIDPATVTMFNPSFSLQLYGNKFQGDCVVKWSGQPDLIPNIFSNSIIYVQVPASYITTFGTASITVFNPGPGGGTSQPQTLNINYPHPFVTDIQPTSIDAGSSAFTLNITGSQFVAGAKVKWPGQADLTPSNITATSVTVTVPASYIVNGGDVYVNVANPGPGGGDGYNAQQFHVHSPFPTLTSISQSSAVGGDPSFTLTLTGTNFSSTSVVNWTGQNDLTPATQTATQLTVAIPDTYLATPGLINISVTTPLPGGGTSTSQLFTILTPNPIPTLASLSPSQVNAGSALFTLTLNGTNFLSNSTVKWPGKSDLVPTATSPTQLTVDVPASYVAMGAGINVKVNNPAPGGGDSNVKLFSVVQPPTITSANNATFVVGTASSFPVAASGFPAPSLSLTGSLPSGLSFDGSAGTISGTAAAGTGGIYNLSLKASNGIGADFTQPFTLTVNQVAAITSAAATTFNVGTNGTFTVTKTGFPAPNLSYTGNLPSGVTFNTSNGLLSGTPGANTGGSYPLTITATNGIGTAASQNFVLTVNQPLAITSANNKTMVVGTADSFQLIVTGFPTATLSSSGTPPLGVTFNASNGTLSGTPAPGSGGIYNLTFTASNGVSQNQTQNFTLTINEAPQITSANSVSFSVSALGSFQVTKTGFPAPTLSQTGPLPSGVTFNTSTGVLSGTPAAGTTGNYPLTINANNGVGTQASQSFTLSVINGPSITSANNTAFVIGTAGTFTVTTTGSPVPTIARGGVTLPGGVTFTDNLNGTATLAGTPAAGTAGTYALTFTATNGVGSPANQNFTLTINQAPAITSANNVTFNTGTASQFPVTATGSPTPALSVSGMLPSGMTFSNGLLSGTPAVGSGGTYPLTFTANNGIATPFTQNFTLTINQIAVVTSANATTFTAGTAGTFTVTATGFPTPTLGVSGALPSGVLFNSSNGVLSGTPAAGTGGTYPLTVSAASNAGPTANQSFTLTVNEAPAVTSANNASFAIGGQDSFSVTTSGFPAPTLNMTGTLPSGVTFNSSTGVLSGSPAAGSGGSYPLVFSATNGIGSNATQNFTLNVLPAPAFTSVASKSFIVGTADTFTVTTTGTPPPAIVRTGPALPNGVTFTDNGSGTGTLAGTPASGEGGIYNFGFTATNGVGNPATQSFTLTVNEAPAITSASSKTFTVGTAGTFTVVATGFPAPTLSMTGTPPGGVSFNTSTGVLSGTPAANCGGVYSLTFKADNGIGTQFSQTFTLTVNEAPAITSANSATFTVGTQKTVDVFTTGYPVPTISRTGNLPSGLTFNAGPGHGHLMGTAALGTGGQYPLTFTATNGIGTDATQNFTLTVNEAPKITSALSVLKQVNTQFSYTIVASGFPAPTFTASPLPNGLTLNGATISGVPTATGQTQVTLTATNSTSPADQKTLLITITGVPPDITSPLTASGTVGTPFTYTITATGPTPITFTASPLPAGLSLTGDTISGMPTVAGVTNVVLRAENGNPPDSQKTLVITISAPSTTAPVITSLLTASGTVGVPFSYTPAASGTTPILFTAAPLPAGLSFTGGVISGTPTDAGVTSVVLTASNGTLPNDTKTLLITIGPAPVLVFDSAPTASLNPALVGQPVTFTALASGPGPVTYTWSFGDNTSDVGASVTHAFSPANTYTVTVVATKDNLSATALITLTVNAVTGGQTGSGPATLPGEKDSDGDGVSDAVEKAAGTDPMDAKSTIGNGQQLKTEDVVAPVIKISKKKVLTLSGSLHIPADFVVAGQTMVVDIEGFTQKFTLDAKGAGKTGKDQFKMSIKLTKKKVLAQTSKFKLVLNNVPDVVDPASPLLIVIGGTVFTP